MEASKLKQALEGAREGLSSIEHQRWAHWQAYMHSKCVKQPDGSLIIPADLVAKWERQIATTYDELSDEEKQSDREQVDRYIPFLIEFLSKRF
ncbi:hypothetical protein [Methylobacterium sp. CM6247]